MSSMWLKTLILNVIVLFATVILITLPVSADINEGLVQGQIENLTQGGGNITALKVDLAIYQGNNSLGAKVTTTDAQGKFEFTGLSTDAEYNYQLGTVYQDAEYNSPLFGFDAGQIVKTLNMGVWDSTSSEQYIKVRAGHVLISVEDGSMIVSEWYILVNEGDTAYIGSDEHGFGERETLRFSLSRDAIDPTYEYGLEPSRILRWDGGISDIATFFPSTTDDPEKYVVFSYRLNYTTDSYTLPITAYYPIDSFALIVEGERQIVAKSAQLVPGESTNDGGVQTSYYFGEGVPRYTSLDISLAGLLGESKETPWAIIVPSIMVVGLAIGFLLWTRTRSRRLPTVESRGPPQDEEVLLQEIARLDEAFERGDVSKEEYLEQRREKKNQLSKLMQRRRS